MSRHLYPENLSLARQLLAWSQSTPLGVVPEAQERAWELALELLRPLARSLEAGHLEALFELCAASPDEDERRDSLIEAAAWGFADAVEPVLQSEDTALIAAVDRRRHSLQLPGDWRAINRPAPASTPESGGEKVESSESQYITCKKCGVTGRKGGGYPFSVLPASSRLCDDCGA